MEIHPNVFALDVLTTLFSFSPLTVYASVRRAGRAAIQEDIA